MRLSALGAVLSLLLAGCSNNSTTSAQFTASMTAPAPGLVKLVEMSRAGSRVVVDAVLFGPDPGLDLFAFKFGVRIGDSSLVQLAPQSSYPQNALIAGDGQTIAIDVDGTSDPSLVQVVVTKQGGGAGNGVAGASAMVIELAFDVHGSGATTLTLVGLGNVPPRAIDSADAAIAAVTFDAASAAVRGVTTGGSGY
jgi:hypothetical protein